MAAAVATRYARALAGLTLKADPREVLGQLEIFESALAASAALRQALLSPAVPAPDKRCLVSKLAAKLELSDVVRRFLLVLADRRRTSLLPEIREAFEAIADERLGQVRADVSSARELTPDQREALIAGLSRLTGKKARARFAVEPELIGGIVARIGSTIYDGSIRGQLEAVKRHLAGTD